MPKQKMEEFIITDELSNRIVSFLDKALQDKKRRAIPMPDVYSQFEKDAEGFERYQFQKALSDAAKTGKLGKYAVLLGKGGGLGVPGEKTPPSSTEKAPAPRMAISPPPPSLTPNTEVQEFKLTQPSIQVESQVELPSILPVNVIPVISSPTLPANKQILPPSPKQFSKLEVAGKVYNVPADVTKMRSVIVNVFEAKEDPNGDIVFDGIRYSCEDERVRQYLDNFVFFCMEAVQKIECLAPDHTKRSA